MDNRLTQMSVNLERVAAIGEKLRQLTRELEQIFPEREHLIQQILYALLTREHVLVFGTFGTGKSDLANTLFECIVGANVFQTGFDKFMTTADLIGIPDPRKLRECGEVHYNPEGGVLSSDFAEFDEFFDANTPLLRVLLGILNERVFKRGRQVERVKLMTAIASTNTMPQDEMRKDQRLGAIVDRFLFQANVEYLKSSASRRRMLQKFLVGEQPSVRLTLDDLTFISGIVVGANQITDDRLIAAYDEVIDAYCAATKTVISDRRRCKLMQLAEANALLYGRYGVLPEDIAAVRWGLCTAGTVAEHDAFVAASTPIIEKATAALQQDVDQLQVKLLEKLEEQLPTLDGTQDDAVLAAMLRGLDVTRKEADTVKPSLPTTDDRKRQLLARIEALSVQVHDRIVKRVE